MKTILLLILTAFSLPAFSQKQIKLEEAKSHIGDSVAYLESLEKAGWLTMSVLPAEQPDPIFRGINPS